VRWIKKEEQLLVELKQYKESGIGLLLDGQPSSPKKIAKACQVNETSTYMRDYISDDSDEVHAIAFVRVKSMDR